MIRGGHLHNSRIYQASKHIEFVNPVFYGQVFISDESKRARRCEILEWISKIAYVSHHRRISETRLDGTGEWIFKKEEFRKWRSSSVSMLLLLRGIPGAGKTYTASRVIDSFKDPAPETLTYEKLGYFYCDRAEENRRDPEIILNTLVQQLVQTSAEDDVLKPVVDIYEEREQRGQKCSSLSLTESRELLIKLATIYPQMTICIDALDEVDHEKRLRLLATLRHVVERSKNVVKIFATTRMDPDILRQFQKFPKIELLPDDNIGDINRFIEVSVQRIIGDGRLLDGSVDGDLRDEICEVLQERSRGMFQLASLHITFLCDMFTPKDVRDSLRRLPDTLIKAYAEIYNRILAQNGSAPRLALNAFRWIQCSYEPLRTETLLDAITAEVNGSGEFSHDTVQANDLLKACQNLVVLDERLDVFRLAHLSVNEYLETKMLEVESHAEISKVCLSLLCTSRAWDHYDTALPTHEASYRKRHLLLYTTVFWPWHFSRCLEDCPILSFLWKKFLSGENHQRWLEYHRRCVRTNRFSGDNFWFRSDALQQQTDDVLSSICVFRLVRQFATVFEAMTIKEGRIDHFLLQSCQFGDLDVAQLLLEVGAKMSIADRHMRTPLHLASRGGHEEVARLLIARGASIEATDRDGRTPLHLALVTGHEAVAQLLLDAGADVNATTGDGCKPLHLALAEGHELLAGLLISRSANVRASDRHRRTPLHLASHKGYDLVASQLIDRGADVGAADEDGQTPLHLASEGGRLAVAQLLIDRKAKVSATGMYRRTPLHFASQRGHEAVARLLVGQGANVAAADEDGQTPLHLSLREGHQAIARLLVDWEADRSATDTYGRTPAQLTLDVGLVPINPQVADLRAWQTTSRIVLQEGQEAVARQLLGWGAGVSASDRIPLNSASQGAREATAGLRIALQEGQEAVARLLLDWGAGISDPSRMSS